MLALVLWNCSSSADLILPATEDAPLKLKSGKINTEEYVCNPQSAPLLTEQNHAIGIVNLSTEGNGDMLISVSVKNGWRMKNIQLYVGAIELIPKDSEGNPSLDLFTQTASFDPRQTDYAVSLTSEGFYRIDDIPYCAIAIHANIDKLNRNGRTIQSEEVWIAGQEISPGQSWATFYPYERIPCNFPQP